MEMILIKKIRIIALISILCLLIVYLLWNNMSLKGNWPDDSDTVSIEWYDYKGMKCYTNVVTVVANKI